jgi:hypothetical protein
MKYPTIPGLTAPRSAWNRMLAPMFDMVERAFDREKRRKPAKRIEKPQELQELIEKGA